MNTGWKSAPNFWGRHT